MKSVIAFVTISLFAVPAWLAWSAETSDSNVTVPDATQTATPKLAATEPTEKPAIQEELIILTVDKKTLTADLKTWPENPGHAQTLKSFKIAVGKAEGDKLIEGDNKTPEGIYFAQGHIPGKQLPKKYGSRAIPINFPNLIDKVEKKTGYGIWLHGVEYSQRIEEAKVTEGCVAFYNPDINRLGAWLQPHQAMIVIAEDSSKVNLEDDINVVTANTQAWMQAWADRRIDDYIAAYADDFLYQRMDVKSYRDYKERIFNSYKKMTVEFDTLRVITHPKYAVAVFNQDFRGDDRFVSLGRKILYWEKTQDGNWKIKREKFENRRLQGVRYTDAELALLAAEAVDDDTKENTSPAKAKTAQATN